MFTLTIEQLLRLMHELEGLVIPGVTKEWLDNCNGGNPINTFFFADDGAIVAATEASLQRLVNRVHKWSIQYGLQLNTQKCVTTRFCKSRTMKPLNIWVDDVAMPCKEEFKYLGCTITRKASVKSIGDQRLNQVSKQVDVLTPLCRKLHYAIPQVRSRISKAVVEGSVFYASELWAWGPAMITARQIVGLMGIRMIGMPKNSCRLLGMLEANMADIGAVSLAKRVAWDRRIKWGSASPTKALWASTSPSNTMMGRICNQIRATRWGDDEVETLKGPRRAELLQQWTRMNIATLASTAEPVVKYLEEYWLTEGQSTDANSKQDTGAVRTLHLLRTNTLWYWPRLRHISGSLNMDGCIACHGREVEDRNHILLDCPAWAEARKEHLGPILDQEKENDRETVVRKLLGGRDAKAKEWEERIRPAILQFLSKMRQERQSILQLEGIVSPPKP